MIHLVHDAIISLGMIGTGEAESPLAANSPYSEILRLLQVGVAAAVIYLVKLLKETKATSSETHNQIQTQIDDVKRLAQSNFETNRNMITEILAKVEALEKR
jgi:hypothetical protein